MLPFSLPLVTPFLKLRRWVLTHLTGVTCIREGGPTARTQPGGAGLSCGRCPGPAAAVPCGSAAGQEDARGLPQGNPHKESIERRTRSLPVTLRQDQRWPFESRPARARPGVASFGRQPSNAGGLRAARPLQVFPRIPITAAVPSGQIFARESGQQPSSCRSDLPAPPRTVPTRPPHAPPGPPPCAPRAAEPPPARPHGYLPRAW